MKNITYWTITVAIAGFLFGFDTIVISGADLPIQKLWNTSPEFHGLFIITMVAPAVLEAFSSVAIFMFFAIMMVLQLVWVLFVMPETKGVPLEELQKKLMKD